jgi:hypothetical protein
MSVWVVSIRLRTVPRVHVIPDLSSFLFLLCTLLEKDLPQNVLLLLVTVVILDIIVMRLVKDRIVIMITIRIFVSYPPCLCRTQSLRISIRIHTHRKALIILLILIRTPSIILILIWTCNQKYPFMKPAYNWNFRLLLLLSISPLSILWLWSTLSILWLSTLSILLLATWLLLFNLWALLSLDLLLLLLIRQWTHFLGRSASVQWVGASWVGVRVLLVKLLLRGDWEFLGRWSRVLVVVRVWGLSAYISLIVIRLLWLVC